ncbi:MAG: hypothetical protein AB8G86_13855 [Saprospiraceae bacterium]
MTLKTLLKLQLGYYALGMLFNAGSWYSVSTGAQQWTPNAPIPAAMFMTLYAAFLIPGFLKKVIFYRILMGVAVLLMGYGGVIKHIDLTQNSPELYCCTAAMIIGPGINVFGLILNLMGVSGRFNE